MSLGGEYSPLPDDGSVKAKKKVNHNRVSMLNFSDEVMEQAASQEIDVFADCTDQPISKPNRRRSSMVRRRSSMGGAGSLLPEKEQVRIAEMYKTVIQMSSENKLTEKNSWNFDLIDHMGRLIRDESKTVNFQKASCTLDASVKIYSNRVDDTYASSHRILESLSRGATADGDGDGATAASKPGKAKVGSKTSSARLNLTDTIERNVENLNVVKLEHDYAFDPMFHKLSKAFDEGGAKGMLLYNMRVSQHGCSLSFLNSHTEQAMKTAEKAHHRSSAPNTIDMADLVLRSGLAPSRVNALCISEKLAQFNDILKRTGCEIGIKAYGSNPTNQQVFQPFAMKEVITVVQDAAAEAKKGAGTGTGTASAPFYSPGSLGATTAENSPIANAQPFSGIDAGALADMEAPDFDDYGGDLGDIDEGLGLDSAPATPEPAHHPRISSAQAMGLFSPSATKLAWAAQPDEASAPTTAATAAVPANQEVVSSLLQLQIDPHNDYAYINLDQQALLLSNDLLNSNNAWAGARHWKYPTRSQKKPDAAASTDGDLIGEGTGPTAVTAAGKKTSASKKKEPLSGRVEFSTVRVDPKLFSSSKTGRVSKKDTTLFTAAALSKMSAEKDLLLLPLTDEKLAVKDLCRLSTLPHIVIPPKYLNLQSLVAIQSTQSAGQKAQNDKSSRLRGMVDSVLMLNHYDDHLLAQVGAATGPVGGSNEVGFSCGPWGETGGAGGGLGVSTQDDDDYGGVDYADEDYGDTGSGGFEGDGAQMQSPPKQLEGLQVDTSRFVQAHRTVGKMHINYAKVSKRVNVAKLKADLWDQIDTHIDTTQGGKSTEESSMSFKELLEEAHSEERVETMQKDASLAYYFICLLHLANEKNLEITGQEDMADLTITQGH